MILKIEIEIQNQLILLVNLNLKIVKKILFLALSSSSQSRKESSTNSLTKTNNASKIAIDVEKHAQKIANLSLNKLSDPKLANRLSASSASRLNLTGSQTSVNQISTGIPKPTAAIKGNLL